MKCNPLSGKVGSAKGQYKSFLDKESFYEGEYADCFDDYQLPMFSFKNIPMWTYTPEPLPELVEKFSRLSRKQKFIYDI